MIIDITNMFNYQIICNQSFIVGTVHSYTPTIISGNNLRNKIILNRKASIAHIIKASLVEE